MRLVKRSSLLKRNALVGVDVHIPKQIVSVNTSTRNHRPLTVKGLTELVYDLNRKRGWVPKVNYYGLKKKIGSLVEVYGLKQVEKAVLKSGKKAHHAWGVKFLERTIKNENSNSLW